MCRQQYPAFEDYFSNTWLKAHPPTEWARYARPSDVPSGDQSLEAYHRRMRSVVFNGERHRFIALDHAIICLHREIQYWEEVLAREDLFNAKSKAKEDSQARYRRTLSHLTQASASAPLALPAPAQPSPTVAVADSIGEEGVDALLSLANATPSPAPLHATVSAPAAIADAVSPGSVQPQPPPHEQGRKRRRHVCSKCNAPANAQCIARLCATCCDMTLESWCSLHGHFESKLEKAYDFFSTFIMLFLSFVYLGPSQTTSPSSRRRLNRSGLFRSSTGVVAILVPCVASVLLAGSIRVSPASLANLFLLLAMMFRT